MNYLPDDAADLAEVFAGKTSMKGADRFTKHSRPSLLRVLPYYKALSALLIVSSWIRWNVTVS